MKTKEEKKNTLEPSRMWAKKMKKNVHNLYNEIKLKHECVMYIKWSRMIATVKKKTWTPCNVFL